MAKTLKEVLESFDFNRAALAKQRLANLRHTGRKVRGARIANLMRMAGLREEEMDDEDLDQLDEVLAADASASDWIHDFVHSTNPKFEGKSKKDRIKMALGAYYHTKNKKDGVGINEACDECEENDKHFAAQSPKMQDAINLHLRKGKSYKDAVEAAKVHVKEELHPNQKKLDKNKNGKLDAQDFKMLRKEDVEELDERNKANATMRKNMDASRGARYKYSGNPVPDPDPKKHSSTNAYNKSIGRALRNMDEESQYAGLEKEDKPGKFTAGAKSKHPKGVNIDTVEGWKDAKKPVKEETEMEKQISFAEFLQLNEMEFVNGRYVHKGTYGTAKGAKYGNTDYERDTLDTKDDEGDTEAKRGRGRPAGAKSGARKITGTSKLYK